MQRIHQQHERGDSGAEAPAESAPELSGVDNAAQAERAEQVRLKRTSEGDSTSQADRSDAVGQLSTTTRGAGSEIPYRAEMEAAFGEDFGSVRAHTGQKDTLDGLGAEAAATGESIAFAGSNPSKELVAHELTHVVQQRKHGTSTQGKTIGPAGDAAEREADAAASVVAGGGQVDVGEAPGGAVMRKSGAQAADVVPAVQPEMESEVAAEPEPEAPSEITDEEARKGAKEVLEYIKAQAEVQASQPLSVDASSMFYTRLKDHYLADYLEDPSPEAGATAADEIGKPLETQTDPDDFWETHGTGAWAAQDIPEGLRALRPELPDTLAAGTDALSMENRKHMPYIDVPQMLGRANTDTGADSDVTGGGKNISQLMHWATGVKYSDVDAETMRELFLAYEIYHLEGWDVFAEDPINDLISEEQGRILGTQLRGGEIDESNLQAKLNAGFAEARAWVGTLLRGRQGDLDAWILSETPVKANMWFGELGEWDVWGGETIFTQLKGGLSVDELKNWGMTRQIIDIYTLVYEAGVWEKANGRIRNSGLIKGLVSGDFDQIMEKSVKGEALDWRDKLTAVRYVGIPSSPKEADVDDDADAEDRRR